MNIAKPLSLVALAGLTASCTERAGREIKDERLNILLIVSDDHGTDDLGCYGNPTVKTPHLDALAADGVTMNRAYCTSASCSASRSVILTGLFNHATGQYGHTHYFHHFRTFENVRSLPVMLEEAGYRTARVGKYHVAPEEVYRFGQVLPGHDRNPVEMAGNCEEFLSEKSQQPFFLYFCTSDPHRGGGIAEEMPFAPDRFGNRPEGYYGVEPVMVEAGSLHVPPYLPDTDACRAELAQYYQSVSRVDQGIGELVRILKKAGKYDNTLVIYISDNGIAFPGAKTNLYDAGMRLPCVIRDPSLQVRGQDSDAMISWVDITPTLLDYAGVYTTDGNIPGTVEDPSSPWRPIPYHTRFHGRSFKPLLQGQKTEGWDTVYASHTFHEITMYYPMRVVQNRQYKLIWNLAWKLDYPFSTDLWASATWQNLLETGSEMYGPRMIETYIRRPEFELFDIAGDPMETKNLAGNVKYADILDEMKRQIKAFQERTGDPWVIKWEYQ